VDYQKPPTEFLVAFPVVALAMMGLYRPDLSGSSGCFIPVYGAVTGGELFGYRDDEKVSVERNAGGQLFC
jgi:hypothetical protein